MVLRNNSSKGIFGEITSDSKKLKLSGDSRWLQKVALKRCSTTSQLSRKDRVALTSNEDIPHGFGICFAVVPAPPGNVTARIPVIGKSTRPEPDPRVRRVANFCFVAYDADPGPRIAFPVPDDVEPLPVASPLQR